MSDRLDNIFRGVFGAGPRGLLPEERGDWDEEKHPRGPDGKFGSGGGSKSSKAGAPVKVKEHQGSFSFVFVTPTPEKPKAPAPKPEPAPAPEPSPKRAAAAIEASAGDAPGMKVVDYGPVGQHHRLYKAKDRDGIVHFDVHPDGRVSLGEISSDASSLDHAAGLLLRGVRDFQVEKGVDVVVPRNAPESHMKVVNHLVVHGLVRTSVTAKGETALFPVMPEGVTHTPSKVVDIRDKPKAKPEPEPKAPRESKSSSKGPTAAQIQKVSTGKALRAFDVKEGSVQVRGYTVPKKPGMVSFQVEPGGASLVAVSNTGTQLRSGFKQPGPEHIPGVLLAGLRHLHVAQGRAVVLSERATPEVHAAVDLLVKHGLVKKLVGPTGRAVLAPTPQEELPTVAKPKTKSVPAGHGELSTTDKDKYPMSKLVSGITSQPAGSVERKIREIEYHEMANLPKERACVYDANGKALLVKAGKAHSVEFTMEEAKLMKDAIMTHNHPSGLPFSTTDFELAAHTDAKEIRAVGRRTDRDGVTRTVLYRAVRGANGWPLGKNITRSFQYHSTPRRIAVEGMMRAGKVTFEEAKHLLFEDLHDHWTKVAQVMSFTYERVKMDA